jgi:hypothetical protein
VDDNVVEPAEEIDVSRRNRPVKEAALEAHHMPLDACDANDVADGRVRGEEAGEIPPGHVKSAFHL